MRAPSAVTIGMAMLHPLAPKRRQCRGARQRTARRNLKPNGSRRRFALWRLGDAERLHVPKLNRTALQICEVHTRHCAKLRPSRRLRAGSFNARYAPHEPDCSTWASTSAGRRPPCTMPVDAFSDRPTCKSVLPIRVRDVNITHRITAIAVHLKWVLTKRTAQFSLSYNLDEL
jgi:hypothetical protein